MLTKPVSKLTLHDKLSRLSYRQACLLLGTEGAAVLGQGGKVEITPDVVQLSRECLRVEFPGMRELAWVEIRLSDDRKRRVLMVTC